MNEPLNVLITFHLAPELIEKIRGADTRIEITYEPGLLGKPRYPNAQYASRSRRWGTGSIRGLGRVL